MTPLRLAILISGRGSNMETLLKACTEPEYPAAPELVISNRPAAAGLIRAADRGVRAIAIDHRPYGNNREQFEAHLTTALEAARIEIIALAGFMRILTPGFVTHWRGRLINIHPSLLPKYPGLNTHQRAIDAGDKEAGASVHWVTEGVDEGEVIDQVRVPIRTDDTAERLAARVLPAEHELYPRALRKACLQIQAAKQSRLI